jgi:membrane-bound serine protease (ClpP class)
MRSFGPRRFRALTALACIAAGAVLTALPAGAADDGGIDVVQVDGLLEPSNAALIKKVVREATDEGSSLVIIQLNGTGAVDIDVDALVDTVRDAKVPVAVWIGPSGSTARGASALLALSAPVVMVANGAGIGPVHPLRFDHTSTPSRDAVLQQVTDFERSSGRNTASVAKALDGRLSANKARDLGVTDGVQPTLRQFIVALDGRKVQVDGKQVTLDTAEFVGEGKDRTQQLDQEVRFHKLDLTQQLAHTFTTPWVAYALFVVGFALVIFEFFTAGIGIAGLVGACAVVAACFGFSHLPVQGWAVFLLCLGLFGLAIDLQAGGLGPWTFIGSGSLVAGSMWLYGGSSRLDPSWWVLVIVCGGTVLFMLSGMTAMVRSRFSTPTIGREDLVGEMGVAEVDVTPDGVVRVRDALWKARTNRATPVRAGEAVRVVAVEGIVLEIEPESGGAKDYRERARRH